MKKLAIALFALLGCVSNKPMPSQTVNTVDDSRCKEFYELVNEKMPMDEFETLKETAKELRLKFNEPIDVYEKTSFQMLEAHYFFRCNEIISCNQKDYCISIFFIKDNKIVNLLPILKENGVED